LQRENAKRALQLAHFEANFRWDQGTIRAFKAVAQKWDQAVVLRQLQQCRPVERILGERGEIVGVAAGISTFKESQPFK